MFYEVDIQVVPITFPFTAAHIKWPIERPHSLALTFDFKTSRSMAVLASANVTINSISAYWEVNSKFKL